MSVPDATRNLESPGLRMSTVDDIQKIDVKIFASQGQDIDPYEFVPVLQRWIQEHLVPGVLIDVADYSHMHNGAGVILVGHEYNLSVDYAEGGYYGAVLDFTCKMFATAASTAPGSPAPPTRSTIAKLLQEAIKEEKARERQIDIMEKKSP